MSRCEMGSSFTEELQIKSMYRDFQAEKKKTCLVTGYNHDSVIYGRSLQCQVSGKAVICTTHVRFTAVLWESWTTLGMWKRSGGVILAQSLCLFMGSLSLP
ncbi:uncharacterized [Tachysurus ichikawai]